MWKLNIAKAAFGTALGLVTVLAMAPKAAVAEGSTTRIEPRPYGGAIVTLEHGVRVYRPLPPTKRVIINPNGETPLSLGFSSSRVIQQGGNINVNQNVRTGFRRRFGGGCIPAVGDRC
ncbi:MAG: hypothetical protein AAFO75_12370 [Pseudomonadota bacterium]